MNMQHLSGVTAHVRQALRQPQVLDCDNGALRAAGAAPRRRRPLPEAAGACRGRHLPTYWRQRQRQDLLQHQQPAQEKLLTRL
jgi:hypothetical protein